jgi:hypothetical protein
MGMPARQISTQSFDQILSELGDDPAIPDPHGIRKSSAPKQVAPQAPSHAKPQPAFGALGQLELFSQAKNLGLFLTLVALLLALFIGGLIAYKSIQDDGNTDLEESSHRISALQKEVGLLRNVLNEEIDILYEEMDKLEVSIHSLKEIKPHIKTSVRPAPNPHEQEIRRWRYLGSSQIGGTQQALFHLGKSHVLFTKEALVLGEWRLSHIEKDAAILSHPLGKTIVLKPVKSE